MYTLIASLTRLFNPAVAANADYPLQLMEQAGARFGRSPQQAWSCARPPRPGCAWSADPTNPVRTPPALRSARRRKPGALP